MTGRPREIKSLAQMASAYVSLGSFYRFVWESKKKDESTLIISEMEMDTSAINIQVRPR